MQWDFDNIYEVLSSGISPEITHFQKHTHPGNTWWIKTIVPPDTQLIELWDRIQNQLPCTVRIEPSAWDWYQNPIPNCSTVWLDQSIDITIKKVRKKLDFAVIPFEQGFNLVGQQLSQLLEEQKVSKDPVNLDWQNLLDVANLMRTWTTDTQARARRQIFKVVNNDQNRRSSHKRSKLDPI